MSLHDKSCVLDAFSKVIMVPPERMVEEIGHFGLTDGFHTQEVIELLLNRGFSVTAIERSPTKQHPVTLAVSPVVFPEGNDERFGRHMSGTVGVLTGRIMCSAKPHAVAWLGEYAWDPSIDSHFKILNQHGRPDDLNFHPLTYYRID